MNRAITHLIPCVQPMAIGAEKPQISYIGSPVTKAVTPHTCSAFVAQLFRRVDVVNIKNAIIALTAHNAASPKAFNQGQLSAPITRVFVRLKAMLVPMVFSTLFGAKAMFAIRTAPLATRLSFPTCREITGLAAILPSPIFEAIEMHFKLLLAVAASHCDRCLFHVQSILYRNAKVKFDIACKRIEDAQRQGDMFIEGASRGK